MLALRIRASRRPSPVSVGGTGTCSGEISFHRRKPRLHYARLSLGKKFQHSCRTIVQRRKMKDLATVEAGLRRALTETGSGISKIEEAAEHLRDGPQT
ncbi:hypothetical protein CMUS01_06563 [Colletotrichum musicola]|uniref:Uncharacterized protein n=1 Tax=Colletotrichum musicola TaxID=2175873 RepID=A0A8H6KLR8_9PEZI|nr:hypothetical protein CMUS01_06563 [Colletotrichum musicola]